MSFFSTTVADNGFLPSVPLATLDINATTGGRNYSLGLAGNNSEDGQPPNCGAIGFDNFAKVKISVLLVLFIVTNITNIYVLVVSYRLRRRHSLVNLNRLIGHLCVADLLVGVFCMFGEAMWTVTSQWLAGDLLCRLFKFGQTFSATLSTMIICVISIDRALIVLLPLHRNRIERRVRVFLIMALTISIFTSCPQLGLFTVAKAPFKKPFYQCIHLNYIQKFPNWANHTFFWVNYSVNYLIPLAFITCTYALVLIRLQIESKRQFGVSSQSSSINFGSHVNNSQQETSFSTAVISNSVLHKPQSLRLLHEPNTRSQQYTGVSAGRTNLLRRAKIKSLQLSFMIVLSFLVCWTPYYIVYLLSTLMPYKCTIKAQLQYIFFFGQLSGVFNPLIYGMFHCHSRSKRQR